jgi:hypothetical protein
MNLSSLAHIDSTVGSGKAVVTADDATVVDIVKQAIQSDASVSFYLTRAQADAIKDWYWTPERTELTGIKPISDEEAERIKAELGIEHLKNFRYAPIQCECGHTYSAFDFLQQGVREHGLDAVNAVFGLKYSTFFQVNPSFTPICPSCENALMRSGGGWYDCEGYGGCCCCAQVVFKQDSDSTAPEIPRA